MTAARSDRQGHRNWGLNRNTLPKIATRRQRLQVVCGRCRAGLFRGSSVERPLGHTCCIIATIVAYIRRNNGPDGDMARGSDTERTAFQRTRRKGWRRLLRLPGGCNCRSADYGRNPCILVATPITPDRRRRWRLFALNAHIRPVLIALVGRGVHRIAMARRHSKAASRLHVRIVAMFALVAAIPRS